MRVHITVSICPDNWSGDGRVSLDAGYNIPDAAMLEAAFGAGQCLFAGLLTQALEEYVKPKPKAEEPQE